MKRRKLLTSHKVVIIIHVATNISHIPHCCLPDPDSSNLPTENAPPPSYVSVSKDTTSPPGRPPPPMPKQAPAMPPRPQESNMFSFGDEPPPPTFDEVYDVSTV